MCSSGILQENGNLIYQKVISGCTEGRHLDGRTDGQTDWCVVCVCGMCIMESMIGTRGLSFLCRGEYSQVKRRSGKGSGIWIGG